LRGLLFFLLSFTLGGVSIFAQPSQGPTALNVKGDIHSVHDPSMIENGGEYYLFTTGDNIPIRCSSNLIDWKACGTVFQQMPQWAARDIPGATNIWAPDISYFNGLYYLYFAVSTFGSNRSDIGLVTTPTLESDGKTHWIDRGLVFASHYGDDYNAIDPNVVLDSSNRPWLAFGSFWSGLQLMQIDLNTGKPRSPRPKIYQIAERTQPPDAIEASFIIHRKAYYYLFASYDFCCRGVNSTYNIRVGRSTSVSGPYVDSNGVPMLNGGGTMIAYSHKQWRGPGGESILHGADGKWWIVYHSYDAKLGGVPTLRIDPLVFNRNEWPVPVTPIPNLPYPVPTP
jgi:arabinan endo-1,5-alpha-L-arabinosidase